MSSHTATRSVTHIRAFFRLAAATTFLIGGGLLLVPAAVTNIFLDQMISDSGLFFIRFAGTSLLGFSLLNWYVAYRNNSLFHLAALVNLASLAPATLLSFWTYSGDYIDEFKWLIVLEHVFFLAGFTLCWHQTKDRAD